MPGPLPGKGGPRRAARQGSLREPPRCARVTRMSTNSNPEASATRTVSRWSESARKYRQSISFDRHHWNAVETESGVIRAGVKRAIFKPKNEESQGRNAQRLVSILFSPATAIVTNRKWRIRLEHAISARPRRKLEYRADMTLLALLLSRPVPTRPAAAAAGRPAGGARSVLQHLVDGRPADRQRHRALDRQAQQPRGAGAHRRQDLPRRWAATASLRRRSTRPAWKCCPPAPSTNSRAAGSPSRLTFFTPALPDDLDVLSRPLTYIEWRVCRHRRPRARGGPVLRGRLRPGGEHRRPAGALLRAFSWTASRSCAWARASSPCWPSAATTCASIGATCTWPPTSPTAFPKPSAVRQQARSGIRRPPAACPTPTTSRNPARPRAARSSAGLQHRPRQGRPAPGFAVPHDRL